MISLLKFSDDNAKIVRFEIFFDNKEFELIETPLPNDDPLSFEDNKKYTDRLKAARKITNQNDAVLIAKGKVKDIEVVVGAQDFRFIGGSFGAASGEAFIAGAQHAIENKTPFLCDSLPLNMELPWYTCTF